MPGASWQGLCSVSTLLDPWNPDVSLVSRTWWSVGTVALLPFLESEGFHRLLFPGLFWLYPPAPGYILEGTLSPRNPHLPQRDASTQGTWG